MNFYEFDLEPEVLDGLDAMNFQEATPIQETTIPTIMDGHDLIACAQTGTGKTAAYLLPILNKLCLGKLSTHVVNAIVMVPTRELAMQIDQQVCGFSYFLPVSSIAIYGGTDGITWEQQKRSMELGVDIIIATPGRLLSMIQMGDINLSHVSYFVLDEADRMLDMGFIDDIMQIYNLLPKQEVQTLMFSATMPPKIKKLASSILNHPKVVEIAISHPPETIKQEAVICYEDQKLPLLIDLFQGKTPERTIIFTSSKITAKKVCRELKKWKFRAQEMHSDLDQNEREQVIKTFRSGGIDVLVATNIVSRGIDIDDIEWVINFDTPKDPEDYVHRIGRTARGTREDGRARTFVSDRDFKYFARLENFLGYDMEKLKVGSQFGETPQYSRTSSGLQRKRSYGKSKRQRSTRTKKSQTEAIETSCAKNAKHTKHPRQENNIPSSNKQKTTKRVFRHNPQKTITGGNPQT